MSEEQVIAINESCFICGNDMDLRTKCPQECLYCGEEGHKECDEGCRGWEIEWWAYDGDEVSCRECGAKAWVTTEDGTACVTYDEETEHNIECFKRYEAKKGG